MADPKTRPSVGSGKSDAHSPIALRWVFPRDSFTPIAGRRVLGRDPTCDTVLVSEETSKKHAQVDEDPPVGIIRDLGSTNGVWVNGQRVENARIGFGDVVRVGGWVAVVVAGRELAPFVEIAAGWFGGQALNEIAAVARKIAPTELPVILEGETGAGKEGLARALHEWSGRRGPFVAVNCAALPPALAEAELFGHRKGAFTGAEQASLGYLRAAHSGTLLLDEILELEPPLQAKLLRALEQNEVTPLGETRPKSIDVRVVAATQESLAAAVAANRFRADLLARLDGLTLTLPALRMRREDVAPLFVKFLEELGGGRAPALDAGLIERLVLHDWPYNVRELRMLARRLMILHGHERVLTRAVLPPQMRNAPPRAASSPPKRVRAPTDDEAAFEALVAALRSARGNVSRAASALGITRARAYRLLDARPDFTRADAED